jgi:hypothetical protein
MFNQEKFSRRDFLKQCASGACVLAAGGGNVAKDPVALDYTAWQIIERKRAEQGLQTLEAVGRAPRFIATAADAHHRLGMNDPDRITLVEV